MMCAAAIATLRFSLLFAEQIKRCDCVSLSVFIVTSPNTNQPPASVIERRQTAHPHGMQRGRRPLNELISITSPLTRLFELDKIAH